MTRDLRRLLIGSIVLIVITLVTVLILMAFDLVLDPAIPFAIALTIAAAVWIVSAPLERDDALAPVVLDPDPDRVAAHSYDLWVRRLHDMVDGAQAHRRMTGRELGRVLGEIAAERARAPPSPRPLPRTAGPDRPVPTHRRGRSDDRHYRPAHPAPLPA